MWFLEIRIVADRQSSPGARTANGNRKHCIRVSVFTVLANPSMMT
jgi:hypothetical protein